MSFLRVVGNLLWLFTVGLALAISLAISGILMFISIIGIPFGIQAFKLVVYVLWPFGSEVVQVSASTPGCIGNVLWFVLGGLPAALIALVVGLVAFVTIIGIPLGLILIRMVPLLAFPFGKEVVPRRETATP